MANSMRRCGNGPFKVRLMRQLEKRCGNAARRVPRKNPWWVPGRWVPGRWVPVRWVPVRWVPVRWVPVRWVPVRWVPIRLGPGRWGPGRWVPVRWGPGRWGPGRWGPGRYLKPPPKYLNLTKTRNAQNGLKLS